MRTYTFHSPNEPADPLDDDTLLPDCEDLDTLSDDLGDALPESDLDDFTD